MIFKIKTIRHRLFVALAGLTLLICVCYTGLALVIAYVTEDLMIDRLLEREAGGIAAHFAAHQRIRAPASDFISVYDSIAALPPPARERAAAGSRRAEIFTGTGRHYHLRALALAPVSDDSSAASSDPAHDIYLLADVGPLLVVSQVIADASGVLLLAAATVTGLALLLAWLLARVLVRPLQQLAAEVREVQAGVPVSFSAGGRPDEIGYLAGKLAATLDQLHAALAREQAFARDVSHELRTPLTVMRNALRPATLPAEALTQLRASVAEMGGAVEVLFALARAEQLDSVPFDLRAGIEESLLRLLDGADRQDDWLRLRLPERLPVRGNPQLTALLLNNCLGNALFHGGPGCRLDIALDDGVLRLTNTVDAASPAMTQGFLHGQNLLGRMALAMDWQIAFVDRAGAYTVEIIPLIIEQSIIKT